MRKLITLTLAAIVFVACTQKKEGVYSSSFFCFASSNMAFIVGLP